MIDYQRYVLKNGLAVLAHRDPSASMAAVNLLYKVGARNENPSRTGFAHLFEHLMFGGSEHVPDFDLPVQLACGENNAFTCNDYTDYYMTLPKDNVETAFWLESDRMRGLALNDRSLEVQRKVVVEEFSQRYLNQPYGDLWLLMRPLAYERHPYRWPTIGMTPDHVREASMEEVRAFYEKYYVPNNAILSVAADLEPERVFELAESWFGEIPAGKPVRDAIPSEPPQTSARRLEVRRPVPGSAIVIAFHIVGRTDPRFYAFDVMSDLLSSGNSSRLYRRLVKEERLFSSVNAYVTGDMDPGLFVLTGHLLPETSVQEGERVLWQELERLQREPVPEAELEKVRNKYESGVIFGDLNVMNKAMNLGYYEMLGDAGTVNREIDLYRSVTGERIRTEALETFRPEKSSTLLYLREDEN